MARQDDTNTFSLLVAMAEKTNDHILQLTAKVSRVEATLESLPNTITSVAQSCVNTHVKNDHGNKGTELVSWVPKRRGKISVETWIKWIAIILASIATALGGGIALSGSPKPEAPKTAQQE